MVNIFYFSVTTSSWTFTDVKYCLFDGDEQGLPSFAVQNSRNSWKQFGCGPNHKWITSRSIRCLGRKDCIRISTWTTQVIWWWIRKKSPFLPQKRLFEKEYFCHLVMSKKKTRKIWLITYILLIHNNLWFVLGVPEQQRYQTNPFFPTLKIKSFCVITEMHISIWQIFFELLDMHWKSPKYSELSHLTNFLLTGESQFF